MIKNHILSNKLLPQPISWFNIHSFIKSIYCLIDIFISFPFHATSSEIEFKLNFQCDRPPEYIDEGVGLEVRLQSANYNGGKTWFPIRYYTPRLEVPSEYKSLVELDSAMTMVSAERY